MNWTMKLNVEKMLSMIVDEIGFWKTYQLLLKLMDKREEDLRKKGVLND